MLLSLVLAVSPVVQPVSSGTYRDGGTALNVRVEGTATTQQPAYNMSLFGHQRVATPFTLGDVINNYGLDTDVWGVDAGSGGSVVARPYEAALLLVADGGYAEIQTHRSYRYQAARQQTVLQTVAIQSGPDAGAVEWGNYCVHDGLFWRWNGDLQACRRNQSTYGDGGIYETCATVDAGADYHPENGNIYEIRFAWLGVHEVDWWLNGRQVLGQNFDGLLPSVYMSTAHLPFRAHVTGQGALKYICSSITSEGGQFPPAPGFSQVRPTVKTVAASAGIRPIIALRPAATLNGVHSHIELIPESISCQATDSSKTRIYAYTMPALTGASWVAIPGTGAEYDVNATATTGGQQVCTFGAGDGTHDLHHAFGLTKRTLRQRWLEGRVDTLVVAADSLSGNQDVTCAIEWSEVR